MTIIIFMNFLSLYIFQKPKHYLQKSFEFTIKNHFYHIKNKKSVLPFKF